jgi:hypothetical protein
MTKLSNAFAFAAAVAILAGASFFTSAANAGGAKDSYVETYTFSKPMHGFSGQTGNYYCDYQRLPQRKCVITASGAESCKIVGWTLREMCQ